MKFRILFCMAAVMFFFMEQVAAQKVNKVLQNKEKRQVVYADIINNEAMFLEFMEQAKASGKTSDEMGGSNTENELTEVGETMAELEFQVSENKIMLRQMVRLMKEFTAKNPDFQKEIDSNYPEISAVMDNH